MNFKDKCPGELITILNTSNYGSVKIIKITLDQMVFHLQISRRFTICYHRLYHLCSHNQILKALLSGTMAQNSPWPPTLNTLSHTQYRYETGTEWNSWFLLILWVVLFYLLTLARDCHCIDLLVLRYYYICTFSLFS